MVFKKKKINPKIRIENTSLDAANEEENKKFIIKLLIKSKNNKPRIKIEMIDEVFFINIFISAELLAELKVVANTLVRLPPS